MIYIYTYDTYIYDTYIYIYDTYIIYQIYACASHACASHAEYLHFFQSSGHNVPWANPHVKVKHPHCQSQSTFIYIYTYLHTVQDTYTRGRKKRLLCFFSPLLCVHHFCYYIAHESCVKNTFMLRCRESSGKKKPAVAGTISSMLRCIDSPLSTSWTRSGTFGAGVFFCKRIP